MVYPRGSQKEVRVYLREGQRGRLAVEAGVVYAKNPKVEDRMSEGV